MLLSTLRVWLEKIAPEVFIESNNEMDFLVRAFMTELLMGPKQYTRNLSSFYSNQVKQNLVLLPHIYVPLHYSLETLIIKGGNESYIYVVSFFL